MPNLDDLIQYENENTSLDFKQKQYAKEKHEDLIKDVMAMANAEVEGDRHIIVGIDHEPSGNRRVVGIAQAEFADSATYQQLIRENIEPEISLEYFPHIFSGKLLGVLKISKCGERPYMMRKDFKSLDRGDAFIRKGTQQSKMDRRDFEKIIESRLSQNAFFGEVQVGFDNRFSKEIELATLGKVLLPSDKAEQEIRAILEERKHTNELEDTAANILTRGHSAVGNIFDRPRYAEMFTESLLKELERVKEAYRDSDRYTIYERLAHRLNVIVLNNGKNYIEDATAQLEIQRKDGLTVVDRIVRKARDPLAVLVPQKTFDELNYPSVSFKEHSVVVRQWIGNIKHHIHTCAFMVPLRVVVHDELIGHIINTSLQIFARNLTDPLIEQLRIKVVSQNACSQG